MRSPESSSPLLVMSTKQEGNVSMGMFEGLKRLFGGNAEQPVASQQEQVATGAFEGLASLKPWQDRSLAPEARLESYKALVHEKLQAIASAFDRAGEARDVKTQKEIMNSPETKNQMEEATWLQSATAEEFCERIDRTEVVKVLGRNFLGAEAWKAQGIDVGEVPLIPEAITQALLESDCPLHPGEKIKDTHLLVLIPKTLNGEPHSALKLDELCATRKGSGDKLIHDGTDYATAWKGQDWAKAPQAQSEWVLIPKSDPDPSKVPEQRHFRSKDIAGQQKVNDDHYLEYREVKALELMTAVLLYDLTHKERLLPDYLRCEEPNAIGGSVCVGNSNAGRLQVRGSFDGSANSTIGRALARKS